jgi:hypothetical protein
MKHLVHERPIDLLDSEGQAYDRVIVWAVPQRGGTWAGSIEFVSVDGDGLSTGRETTQSRLDNVAYWASGLKPMYLEGAFRRALKRHLAEQTPRRTESPLLTGAGKIDLCVETIDPEVPRRLLASRALVPGRRRLVHSGGVLVYEGMERRGRALPAYSFLAQYGSDNASAILANAIWNDLHGRGARLSIDGAPVPIDHIAIKRVMLGVLVP